MPRLKPVLPQRLLLLGRDVPQLGADLCAAAEEIRGLAPDDLEVLVFGDVDVASLGKLVQLALNHPERDVAQQSYDVERILGERHRHRLDIEVVAEQDRDVVAPAGVHREPPAPQLRVVDDVVVHERSCVNELDDRRVENGAIARVAGQPRRHQQHGGAHALAAARLDVLADLWDQLHARLDVAEELPLDRAEIGANGLEDLGEIYRRRIVHVTDLTR